MRRSLVFLFALAACAAPKEVPIEDTTFAASLNVDLTQSMKVETTYVRDLEVGTGDEAKTGSLVTMRYTGWLADGTKFDSNVGQPTGFQFKLGAGEVIRGWDVGVPGLKVGGKRQLLIPPGAGYGASGNGPIPGNAVLVFEVTMVSTP
jgi:FKBP-type peptidyl-prolyl cis-trans isomerase